MGQKFGDLFRRMPFAPVHSGAFGGRPLPFLLRFKYGRPEGEESALEGAEGVDTTAVFGRDKEDALPSLLLPQARASPPRRLEAPAEFLKIQRKKDSQSCLFFRRDKDRSGFTPAASSAAKAGEEESLPPPRRGHSAFSFFSGRRRARRS